MSLPLTRRGALGALGALATTFAVPTIVRAAGPLEKVPVAVGSEHALVYLPWDLAKALGYFEAEGLDVDLTYTKGGSEAAQALVSGNCEYSGNAIDHAISAQKQGKSLVMISDFMDQPGISLLVRPQDRAKYKSYKEFNGKTLGVTSVGSATHVLAVWLAKRNGLSRDDIKIVGVGGGSTMMAALSGGQVDGAFGNDPYSTALIRSGRAVPVLEMFTAAVGRAALGYSSYCFTGALTRGDVIAKNPDRTQKIANALVRAQKFMASRSAQQVAQALNDEFRGGQPADTWAAAFSHSRPAYTPSGEISLEGVRAVIDTNAYFLGESADKVDARKLYDNTFVEKAKRSVKV